MIKRRQITLAIVLVIALSLGGCVTDSTQSPAETTTETTVGTTTTDKSTEPGTQTGTTAVGGGKVMADVVSDPPENATVVGFTDDRIGNSSLLEDVLKEAHGMGDGSINVDGKGMEQVSKALADAPIYRGDEFGYYIEYEGETIQVVLARYA
ncbi:hypothetical protein [Haladaptatus cibarius]|uniref:hypothetical protein n=1 Tax=Haladaptatus cibarius TaxID=453847 RepID=UPI00067975C4|nr:hypothetical protein [Haladaptatus cibarius]